MNNKKYNLINLLDNETRTYDEDGFIEVCQEITMENEDYTDFPIESVEDGINYIKGYCENLDVKEI